MLLSNATSWLPENFSLGALDALARKIFDLIHIHARTMESSCIGLSFLGLIRDHAWWGIYLGDLP